MSTVRHTLKGKIKKGCRQSRRGQSYSNECKCPPVQYVDAGEVVECIRTGTCIYGCV